jgi:hypothetical protein
MTKDERQIHVAFQWRQINSCARLLTRSLPTGSNPKRSRNHHTAAAPTGLRAEMLNLTDGGKNQRGEIRPGYFYQGQERVVQLMIPPDGQQKGIRTILQEWACRGLEAGRRPRPVGQPGGLCVGQAVDARVVRVARPFARFLSQVPLRAQLDRADVGLREAAVAAAVRLQVFNSPGPVSLPLARSAGGRLSQILSPRSSLYFGVRQWAGGPQADSGTGSVVQ